MKTYSELVVWPFGPSPAIYKIEEGCVYGLYRSPPPGGDGDDLALIFFCFKITKLE